MTPKDGERRLEPQIWRDYDWYVLRCLRRQIEVLLDSTAALRAGQRVIDFGCGDRPYERLITARGAQYIACDLDGDVDVRIKPGRPLDLPDASADGVVSFQVLEHVWDLDWYLGQCYRLLKPGGWLLLSTHGNWLYHPHPTDYRRWTRDGLVEERRARDFRVETVMPAVGPLAWTTQFRLLGLHHVFRKIPILGPAILAPVACLMNLRMVLEDLVTPTAIRQANASVYVTLSRKPESDKEEAFYAHSGNDTLLR
ncbi:MAG TPA: class I SAM-dependent methyltransferase [Gemmataceae bacterium]|nr:class I SAM-dependent methyltransferase [Gemmataceae bacterium]